MDQALATELAKLGRALGDHPSRMIIWGEGSCAAAGADGRFLVTRRGSHLAKLQGADLLDLSLAAAGEVAVAEQVSEESLAAALGGDGGEVATEDALAYAYLLTLEGVRFAAHTQPIEVNQIICSPRARQFADRRTSPMEILECGPASLLVPYVDPGLPLARELRRKMLLWNDRHRRPPQLVLLQNHGMIALGETAEAVLRTTEMAIKCAQMFIGAALMGGPVFLTPGNVSQVEAKRPL